MFRRPPFLFPLLLTCALPLSAAERHTIDSAEALALALRDSGPGDVLALIAQTTPFRGPIALKNGQTLVGEGEAPIISAGSGAVVTVAETGDAVTLQNVIVRATGDATGIVIRDANAVALHDVSVTTAGATGLLVKKALRLTIDGTSSIAATGGPAADITDAGLDVTLASVTANGTLRRAIALERTTGRFTVAGGRIEGASERAVSAIDAENVTLRGITIAASASTNGIAPEGCGGDLAAGSNERCNAAVFLQRVNGAALENVVIDGSGQAGIVAHAVNGFSLVGSEVKNAGDETFEHGVLLEEMSGTCRIAETRIEQSASRHLMLHNSAGRVTISIEKSRFSGTVTPNGQQAVLISAAKDAAIELEVRDSTFAQTFSNAIDVVATDEATARVRVSGSTFDRQSAAINLAANRAASIEYAIVDNPSITASSSSAINVFLGTPSTGRVTGAIARNVIGRSGVTGSGTTCNCSGISLTANGHGRLAADISGNIIQQVGGPAIVATAGQGGAELNVAMNGNLLREPGNGSVPAIRVSAAGTANDTTRVCADIGGSGANANTIEGSWAAAGTIQLLHRFGGARFQLAGLTDGNSETAAAAAIAARNRGARVQAVLRPDTQEKGFEPAARCAMPALTQ